MSPDLPTVLRNKLVAVIRALRGPQITARDRIEVFNALNENFCPKCGHERSEQCACGPITVAEAEEMLKKLVKADELFTHHGTIMARGDGSTYRMLAEMINKRVMT